MKKILGLDIGYSNLKIAATPPEPAPGHEDPRCLVRAAGVAPADSLPQSFLGDSNHHVEVLVGGEPYAACIDPDAGASTAGSARALHEDYAASTAYRALTHAALLLGAHERIDLLVTGLPVAHYYRTRTRSELSARLRGLHAITAESEVTVTVKDVLIVPQPIGAYFDYASEAGPSLDEARVLVVDAGFFSIDWALIVGDQLYPSLSGSSTLATSRLLEAAAAEMAREHGVSVSRERLERAVRNRQETIPLRNRPVPLGHYLTRGARAVPESVVDEIRASLRGERDAVDLVLCAGGAAPWYAPALKEGFPQSDTPEPAFADPVLANARGFYLLGRLSHRATE